MFVYFYCAGALERAAAANLTFLYLPPGTYRVSRNITLGTPLMLGYGANISVDAGAALRLTAQPQKWDLDGLAFAGQGARFYFC